MAYSPNTTNLPRRRALVRFFAGIAAANIAGTAAGAALGIDSGCPEADAQLFARWREYLKFGDRTQRCSRRAGPDVLECPASLSTQAGLHRQQLGECIPSEIDADVELCAATTDMKSGRQPAAERMAEVEAWVQKCKDINIQFGLPELESAFKAAWDRQWAAFARFVATPATTLAGLAVKTSAIFYFEDETRRAWRGIVTDQKQLEPEQQILLTLRRDLLRMAGLPDDFAMEYAEADEQ